MATNPNVLHVDDLHDLPPLEGSIGWEFVDGQPVPVMPAKPWHGELIVEVAYRLRRHLDDTGLGGRVWSDVGCVLGLERDPERMRSPDVAYITAEKAAEYDRERFYRDLPDLAIEIDLTSGKNPGGQQRVVDYLEAGVRLVWVIDLHTRTAVAYRRDGSARLLREDEALDAEDVLPGFRLELAGLFGER